MTIPELRQWITECRTDGAILEIGPEDQAELLAELEEAEELRRIAMQVDDPVPGERNFCRVCGCTDSDCQKCIDKTGEPCHWVESDLCSACVPAKKPRKARIRG